MILTIHVRPKDGYSYPGRIKTISVDSSQRLEQVVADLKLDTKKGITLFSSGGRNELALNSSLASNNIQSGDILETCSSPMLSCILTAVLNDLNRVQLLASDERTREKIEPLLGFESTNPSSQQPKLDPWPGWDTDSLKSRIISLAFIKKVIQRNDRFASLEVPQMTELVELYAFLQSTIFSPSEKRNSMAHIVKPVNREGVPTTCWQLLQFKLDKITNIAASSSTATTGPSADNVERFLEAEKERHETLQTAVFSPSQGATAKRTRKNPPSGSSNGDQTTIERKRRRFESPPVRDGDKEWECATCNNAAANSICLRSQCPFYKQLYCFHCFSADHPILQRNHECIPLTDPRAKAVLKELRRQSRRDLYCPEYGSGPFSILCILYEQMVTKNQLSLSESLLKELAQPMCRANLYDHEGRGRNAFACVEGLMERNFIRMELLPGRTEQEGKYSLLPAGEALAKYCYAFEQGVRSVIHDNPNINRDQKQVLGGGGSSGKNPISILVDAREDQTYSERLIRRCQKENIPCKRQELVAGDYLFAVEDKVCSVVLERKSWSDLADSVLGKGRRRLDCVRIGEGGGTPCDNRRCQLCKMKASGCSKIMFVIEGARCTNRDSTPNKCKPAKRCQFCRELEQRHGRGVVQDSLEEVLFRLQSEHQCFISYSRSYNETINFLIMMREILGASLPSNHSTYNGTEDDDIAKAIALSLDERSPETRDLARDATKQATKPLFGMPTITYEQFCKNARRKQDEDSIFDTGISARGQVVEWSDSTFVQSIFDGNIGAFCSGIFEESNYEHATNKNTASQSASVRGCEVVDLNESFKGTLKEAERDTDSEASVQLLESEPQNASKSEKVNVSIIDIDDSDEEVNGLQDQVKFTDISAPFSGCNGGKGSKHETGDDSDEDTVIEVLPVNPPGRTRKSSNSILLLIITGLHEYDMESYKDMSEMWKTLYQNERRGGSTVDEFISSCRTELRKLQTTGTPIIPRNSILLWLIFIQLRYGTQVHVVREKYSKEKLQSYWQGHSGSSCAVGLASLQSSALTWAEATHASKSCAICEASVGEDAMEVTLCRHIFHSICLHAVLQSMPKEVRCCPICERPLGTFKDDNIPFVQQSVPKSIRTPTLQGQSSNLQKLREARISRFAQDGLNGKSGQTKKAAQNLEKSGTRASALKETYLPHEGWDCSRCTLHNQLGAPCCAACGASNSTRTNWKCDRCTLENNSDAMKCTACGAPKLDSKYNSSVVVDDNNDGSDFIDPFFCGGVEQFATPCHGGTRSSSPAATNGERKQYTSGIPNKSAKVKCGACGHYGHNRATATEENCSSYYNEEEVKLRAKKKEQNKQRARRAHEEIARLERSKTDLSAQVQQAKQVLASLEQSAEATAAMSQNEVKRLQREKARAEKQARKYE